MLSLLQLGEVIFVLGNVLLHSDQWQVTWLVTARKDSIERIVVLGRNCVVFVIVTAGAGDGQAEKTARDHVDFVIDIIMRVVESASYGQKAEADGGVALHGDDATLPAQRALDYIAQARNGRAGWGRDRGTKTETTVWCVVALRTGKLAGLEVDADAFEGARVWLVREDAVRTNADAGGALLGRIFLGERSAKSKGVIQLAERCLKHLPVWDTEDGSIDMHYWHFGTLGMFQVGSSRWRKWDKAMKVAVVKNQFPRGSGSRTGSWDPMGRGGTERGRVGSTALMVLTLEVYYRYDRVFKPWN